MSVIRLVRHAQASFGAGDYDKLSSTGHRQAQLLGAALRASGNIPALIVRGDMRRHRETADNIVAALDTGVPVETDPGWDEFDHQNVLAAHKPGYASSLLMKADLMRTLRPGKAFQQAYEDATQRWMVDADGADYTEPFPVFAQRVRDALGRAQTRGDGDVLVVTSGGPIGLLVSELLSGDASLWPQLMKVAVNTGVTKLVRGRGGARLVSFNAHEHVEQDRRLITYR